MKPSGAVKEMQACILWVCERWWCSFTHHSTYRHCAELCIDMEIPNTFVHAFLDGRDTDPNRGTSYLKTLLQQIEGTNVRLATVIGRYYAMDRDNRWNEQKSYDLAGLRHRRTKQ